MMTGQAFFDVDAGAGAGAGAGSSDQCQLQVFGQVTTPLPAPYGAR